jgi:hypothetical protein
MGGEGDLESMRRTNCNCLKFCFLLMGLVIGTIGCSDEGGDNADPVDSVADTATATSGDSETATGVGGTETAGTDGPGDTADTGTESGNPPDTGTGTVSDTGSGTPEDSETGTPGDTADSESETGNGGDVEQLTVHYEAGDAQGGDVIYVMWIENAAKTFVQNLFICEKLLNGKLTGIALPFWSLNRKNSSEIDGLSGATRLPEVSITSDIPAEASAQFTVYVELDHSWDDNDWFGDQPALLYAADIDLTTSRTEYTLTPLGWTPESRTTFQTMAGSPSYEAGELCTEMRYITHSQDGNDFGDPDADRSATNMVQTLTVRLH